MRSPLLDTAEKENRPLQNWLRQSSGIVDNAFRQMDQVVRNFGEQAGQALDNVARQMGEMFGTPRAPVPALAFAGVAGQADDFLETAGRHFDDVAQDTIRRVDVTPEVNAQRGEVSQTSKRASKDDNVQPGADKKQEQHSGGKQNRTYREATQQDLDLINDIKSRYNAGKSRNAASAKGTINGEAIDLECVSGKFNHDNYYNKGNFEPPQPENYYYIGPIPEFTNHTEQKIIEYLRERFRGDASVVGEIELISERIFCPNCSAVVDMFETEFPNIKVTRVEVKR